MNQNKGFTLIELLITMAIVGTISAAVILILDPAELLRQARDATRIQDITTLDSALTLYLTDIISGDLNAGGTVNDGACASDVVNGRYYVYGTAAPPTNSFSTGRATAVPVASQAANGIGWLPVDFSQIFGGAGSAPLKIVPVDPTNTGDLVYRYACNMTSGASSYELNAKLESNKYAGAAPQLDRDAKDGGNNTAFYERGTDLTL